MLTFSISKQIKKRNSITTLSAALLMAFVTLLNSFPTMSQTMPSWIWAYKAGDMGSDYGNSLCTDTAGNTYVTGTFEQSVYFSIYQLTSAGSEDIFIMKNDDEGNTIWAKSFGGTSLDYVNKITLDNEGNIIITGAFRSDEITFGTTTLINPNSDIGYDNIFVAKFNAEGDNLWAISVDGDGNGTGSGVATDNNENIIISGFFDGQVLTFGDIVIHNSFQLTDEIFLAKLDKSGNTLWAKAMGGFGYDYGRDVAVKNNGDILLSADFESDSVLMADTTLYNTGGADYFIADFTPEGNLSWLNKADGDADEFGTAITSDADDNTYVTGHFNGTAMTIGNTTLPGNGYDNIFVAKYTPDGQVEWVLNPSGANNDEATGINACPNGMLYVTGEYSSETFTIGAIELQNSTTNEYTDTFIAGIKQDDGSVSWAKSIGGNDDDGIEAVSSDSHGTIYITGYFYSRIVEIGINVLRNADDSQNSTDILYARIDDFDGINNTSSDYDAVFYPNPATENIVIKVKNPTTVEIFNNLGQSVLKTEKAETNTSIALAKLQPGIYFIKFKNKSGVITNKLIKN